MVTVAGDIACSCDRSRFFTITTFLSLSRDDATLALTFVNSSFPPYPAPLLLLTRPLSQDDLIFPRFNSVSASGLSPGGSDPKIYSVKTTKQPDQLSATPPTSSQLLLMFVLQWFLFSLVFRWPLLFHLNLLLFVSTLRKTDLPQCMLFHFSQSQTFGQAFLVLDHHQSVWTPCFWYYIRDYQQIPKTCQPHRLFLHIWMLSKRMHALHGLHVLPSSPLHKMLLHHG